MEAPISGTQKFGAFTRALLHLAGADPDTLAKQCPLKDTHTIRALATITLFMFCLEAALFYTAAERMFAPDGELRWQFLPPALFLAAFIVAIDSFMVLRSGWYLSGVEELKRGGLDISGGPGDRIKAGFFLAVRIFLSVCIAQLSAIFLSILIFAADINSRLEVEYQAANARLIEQITASVDGEIERAAQAFKTQAFRVDQLSRQVTTLRQEQVDPSAGDPEMQEAQAEVSTLEAQRAQAEAALRQDETFASNELGGIKGAPGNSGRPGVGPRRRAAMEEVENAKADLARIDHALDIARVRADEVHKRLASSAAATEQQSKIERPEFEQTLQAESGTLDQLKGRLTFLTNSREETIRHALEASPGYQPLNSGLLSQLRVLEDIAEKNQRIGLVILLIDLTSFGFELSAILAKVTAYVPTTFAAILVRDHYLGLVRLVDGMVAELNQSQGSQTEMPPSRPETPRPARVMPSAAPSGEANPFTVAANVHAQNAKRPRGRPRKSPQQALQVPARPDPNNQPYRGNGAGAGV